MAIWIIATLAAFFVKGMCGFANTLVFTSILGFGAANVNISPVEIVLGYPANIVVTWKNRSKLDWNVVITLSILVLIGSIPGAFLLRNTNIQFLKVVFGLVVILIGIEMFCREYRVNKIKESKAVLYIIGLLSGLLCGLFGIGALLAAYVSRVTDTSDGFKANISAVFIVENTFRIVVYSALGIITIESLKQAVLLMPLMLIGTFAGMKSAKVMDEKLVKKLVIILLIISGAVLVIKNM
ncbi:MAG: sulfite exporter TauE/SafE family protein [Butyrivibrio sp.]|nr:sulfite exporter TauE/SafE family protein [Butyrivibrio sp.]